MEVSVKWVDGVQFVGETGSGHSVAMDGPADHGGQNHGSRPMEMVLLGLAGCAAFDVVTLLRKTRQEFVDCEVKVKAERADSIPSVFTDIDLLFIVTGNNVGEKQVERAVSLSVDKYCSVARMLGNGGVNITHHYQIQ
ncbi:OsmC family protein [Endozoicomonadaceae bacterium StTr2]